MNLECFIYTNGRSTFDYCLKALRKQYSGKITVFRNHTLFSAMNKTLDVCESSHFVQIGDDFVLHPKAIRYMWYCYKKREQYNIAMYNWHLWEMWTSRIVSGVKIYSVEAMKSVGGYSVDQYAKIDKITHTKLHNAGMQLKKDSSVVGLHVCGSRDEQRRYEKLWSEAAGFKYKKSTHHEMKNYDVPVSEQVKMYPDFLDKLNQQRNTKFYNWMQNKEKCITIRGSKKR